MKLKEKYTTLQKKHDLPKYEELNKLFDIEEISPESDLILTKIRMKIHDKIEYFTNLIESNVQPSSDLSQIYEAKEIDDKDREVLYLLFKRLMQTLRHSNNAALLNDEAHTANFIRNSFDNYVSIVPQLDSHIAKLADVWGKDTNVKSELNYFG
jgi:hypothetical protein